MIRCQSIVVCSGKWPSRTRAAGLDLTRVSRTVSRAFDDALGEAGGSLPVWLVLISLKRGQLASQRELADAVGVQAPRSLIT